MRYFICLVLLGLSLGGIAYIDHLSKQEPRPIVTRTNIVIRASGNPIAALKDTEKGAPRQQTSSIDVSCFVWGPFSENELSGMQIFFSRNGLLDQMQIADRFLPEKYIVYLGPYDNLTAVKAFVKQFQQQGYRSVRPILRGALSYGVEIETFDTREAAQAFLDSPKAPNMKGLRVTNRLGEPSDKVDLVFRHVTDRQREALFSSWSRYANTQLSNCGRQN